MTNESPFRIPKTFDEVAVSLLFVVWPLLFIFVIYPDMDLNPAGEVLSWASALVIQVGILYALQNARRHA